MTNRLQIRLTDDKAKQIKRIMKKLNIENQKDLFDEALTLFEWAVKEKESGKIVASMNEKNHTFREVVTPALSRINQG